MNFAVRCEKGKVRENNQDNYLAESGVFAVADGMGGHRGGETASLTAIQSVRGVLAGNTPSLLRMQMAVEAANRRVFSMGREDPGLAGMGTTLSILWLSDKEAFIAHVGDSRIYLFRNGSLSQLTKDHSYVWEMVESGRLTKEQARISPYRNIITRAVGTDVRANCDLLCSDILPGDRFLLCSDGLSGLIEDKEIQQVLAEEKNNRPAADRLLQLALDAGGTDNITILLVTGGERL